MERANQSKELKHKDRKVRQPNKGAPANLHQQTIMAISMLLQKRSFRGDAPRQVFHHFRWLDN